MLKRGEGLRSFTSFFAKNTETGKFACLKSGSWRQFLFGMITKSYLAAAIIVSGTCLVSTAHADHLKFQGDALGSSTEQVRVRLNGHSLGTVGAGKLKFSDYSTSTPYETVCADIDASLDGHSHSYSVSTTNPLGSTALDAAGRIVGTYFASATTADQQAGLQVAVWDALYNGGGSLNLNGHLKVTHMTSGATYWAGVYYAAVNGTQGAALYFHTSDCGGQSQLTAQAVPEPSALMGLGILALGLLRKYKKAA